MIWHQDERLIGVRRMYLHDRQTTRNEIKEIYAGTGPLSSYLPLPIAAIRVQYDESLVGYVSGRRHMTRAKSF